MRLCEDLPEQFRLEIEKAAKIIKGSQKVLIVSHIDTDGITSLAILIRAMERAMIEHTWMNLKQLNAQTLIQILEILDDNNFDTLIFSDMGTGQIINVLRSLRQGMIENLIVIDHHLAPHNISLAQEYANSLNITLTHVNPLLFGLNGSKDVSSSGVAFLVAICINENNFDLADLAIVGATGDMQYYYGNGYTGINEKIIEFGEDMGILKLEKDLTFYGRETRILPILLEYATDPFLPGLTGNKAECINFLNYVGIELKDGDKWRTWRDLEPDEKASLIEALIEHLITNSNERNIQLIGGCVTLLNWPEGTKLHDAKEFSTLLNACGRNDKPEIGVKICLRDPEAYQKGLYLLQTHRANLASGLAKLQERGVEDRGNFYVFEDQEVPETIIGIIIGMAIGSRLIPTDKPVFGITRSKEESKELAKISGRLGKNLLQKGINLKEALQYAQEELNAEIGRTVAESGGHPMAAGAFVEYEFLDDFLAFLDLAIAEQVAKKKKE